MSTDIHSYAYNKNDVLYTSIWIYTYIYTIVAYPSYAYDAD